MKTEREGGDCYVLDVEESEMIVFEWGLLQHTISILTT